MPHRGDRLTPARHTPPGAIIRRELDERCWTQEDLARIVGRPVQVISEIVSAKKQITPETALGLAAAFGTSAEMWLNLEARYRLRLAESSGRDDAVERKSRIYSLVPVKELARRGWIEESESVDELESRIKLFLGVSALDDLPPMKIAARRTATRKPDPRAVLAWTRRVEMLASKQCVSDFSPCRLEEGIGELLKLTRDDTGPPNVPNLLRELGVHFVVVPHLQKTYLDGAITAPDGNPIVALTLRYDRLDSFWFTLMHELAHLVRGHEGNRLEDLDAEAGDDPEEKEADSIAGGWLVPDDAITDFADSVSPFFSRHAIEAFARSIGRHPSIVLGRLHHEKRVGPAHLRSSIPRIRKALEAWTDVSSPTSKAQETAPATVGAGVAKKPRGFESDVLRWLGSNPGWRRPAEVKRALGLSPARWSTTISALCRACLVDRTGEKRGTRYRARKEEG